uniref:Uncharacterized protein n=1 Tax=Meloidogyne javanica TaxID=6303 RepID=A0A915MXR0_MELJA
MKLTTDFSKVLPKHHECLNELLKSCPLTPPAKHFVDIDTTKYEIDNGLFENAENLVKRKGVGMVKKGLKKTIDTLETACMVKTVGLGAPLCSLAAYGLGELADFGVSQLCKLVDVGIDKYPNFNNTDASNTVLAKELTDYSAEAAYNFTLAHVTLLEFEKEKFATYQVGEIAFKTIEELEEVISENL